MKLILTKEEAQQVEAAAAQKLVQDKLTSMIEARVEEMQRELNSEGAMDAFQGEPVYTLKEIHTKFLGKRPIIDTASAAKTLLVPAGVDVSKVKV